MLNKINVKYIFLLLVSLILLLYFFSIRNVFAQTPTLKTEVNKGITELKTNSQDLKFENEVTKGEIQSAGKDKKDKAEIKVPEINVEKEIETENSKTTKDKTASTDKKSSSSKGN